ncbi:MAG: CBS domain-containing protein [Desulfobacteraceae bacterium]|jgi:predicted transcriptional regulator
MKPPKVEAVMTDYPGGFITKITVKPSDKLTDAVKRMLFYNAYRLTVLEDGQPVGVLRLKDALKELGL